ncbi:hypothetical protein V8C35DRAFT_56568 [Trichoderma chlorosporum]
MLWPSLSEAQLHWMSYTNNTGTRGMRQQQQQQQQQADKALEVLGSTGSLCRVQRHRVVGPSQLWVETDTATASWRLISEAHAPETPTEPTEYLAIPCELRPDTRLGDPDRLAVAGKKWRSGSQVSREGKHVDCRGRLTIWRSSTTADDGVRRGLQRGAGAAIMLFPYFLSTPLCRQEQSNQDSLR